MEAYYLSKGALTRVLKLKPRHVWFLLSVLHIILNDVEIITFYSSTHFLCILLGQMMPIFFFFLSLATDAVLHPPTSDLFLLGDREEGSGNTSW